MSMCDKKTLQYCKVISLQLIKINEKRKKKKNITVSCFALLQGIFPTQESPALQAYSLLFESLGKPFCIQTETVKAGQTFVEASLDGQKVLLLMLFVLSGRRERHN